MYRVAETGNAQVKKNYLKNNDYFLSLDVHCPKIIWICKVIIFYGTTISIAQHSKVYYLHYKVVWTKCLVGSDTCLP